MDVLGTIFFQQFCTFEIFHDGKLYNNSPRFRPGSKSQLLLDAMAFLRKVLRTAKFY